MDIQQVTLEGRAVAEAAMLDTCIAHRPGPAVTDPVTGVVSPGLVEVYVGPCKVQSAIAQADGAVAGGHMYTAENLQMHFPVASSLRIDDVVTVTASWDADLVGLNFRLVELARGTFRTADRWNVELVVK